MTTALLELHYDEALIRMLDALHESLEVRAGEARLRVVQQGQALRARNILLDMKLPCMCILAEVEGKQVWVTCEFHEVSQLLLNIQCGAA